jgi:hypothetical protein
VVWDGAPSNPSPRPTLSSYPCASARQPDRTAAPADRTSHLVPATHGSDVADRRRADRDVERDDRHGDGRCGRRPPVQEASRQLSVATEEEQGDERGRDAPPDPGTGRVGRGQITRPPGTRSASMSNGPPKERPLDRRESLTIPRRHSTTAPRRRISMNYRAPCFMRGRPPPPRGRRTVARDRRARRPNRHRHHRQHLLARAHRHRRARLHGAAHRLMFTFPMVHRCHTVSQKPHESHQSPTVSSGFRRAARRFMGPPGLEPGTNRL